MVVMGFALCCGGFLMIFTVYFEATNLVVFFIPVILCSDQVKNHMERNESKELELHQGRSVPFICCFNHGK